MIRKSAMPNAFCAPSSRFLFGKRILEWLPTGLPAGLRLGGAFLQLLATAVIARTLGADRSADFFFWSTILMTFGQVSTFGLDRLVLREVPRLEGDPAGQSRFLGTVRATAAGLALLLSVPLVLYACLLQTGIDRPVWWYLLPPLCLIGVALCMINGDAMTGSRRAVLGICYRHTLPTALFVIALIAQSSVLSPNRTLACFSLAFFIAGFAALSGPGFRGAGSPFQLPGRAELTGHLRHGAPICLSAVFGAVTYLIPLVILERTRPPEETAFLTTSFRLFLLFEILATSVHSLAMPDLSRSASISDRAGLWKTYRGSVVKGATLLALPMLGVALFAPLVMSIFGKEFSTETPAVLRVFLAFGLLSLLGGPATHLVLMVGQTRRLAGFALARLFITTLLSLAVIPWFGPTGLAAVYGAGLLAEKVFCLWSVARRNPEISEQAALPEIS